MTFKKGVMIVDGQSTIEISLGKYPTLCYWVNAEENTISNKIFIQDLDQLDATNPSRTGRTVNQFSPTIVSLSLIGRASARKVLCLT